MAPVLTGKVAWVTGGASGIGLATARKLRQRGASVGILDVADPAEDFKWGHCDLSKTTSVESATAELSRRTGPADILVCSAGINFTHSIADHPNDMWDQVIAVNLSGAFYAIRACLPLMIDQGWGRIITLSSGGAVRVLSNRAAYAASKAGLIAVTKAAALEGAQKGVTANVVAPGLTDTDMAASVYGSREGALLAGRTSSGAANPMGVLLDPEDIANGIDFLCGPDARFITGQVLHINAGSVM